MNSTPKTTLPPDTRADESEPDQVGVALVNVKPGETTLLSWQLLKAGLESGLRNAEIAFKETGGLLTDSVALWVYDVPDRRPAMRALRHLLEKELNILPQRVLAYNDRAEGYWRSVAGLPVPFDQLLSEQFLDASETKLLQYAEWFTRALSLASGQTTPPPAAATQPIAARRPPVSFTTLCVSTVLVFAGLTLLASLVHWSAATFVALYGLACVGVAWRNKRK